MKIVCKQTINTAYHSFFEIRNDNLIGSIIMDSQLIPKRIDMKVAIFDQVYECHPTIANVASKTFTNVKYPIREFQLFQNNEVYGYIHVIHEGNFISNYAVTELVIDNVVYKKYTIGRGDQGYSHTVFLDDTQVGLIEMPSLIHDEKYQFVIYVKNPVFINVMALYVAFIASGLKKIGVNTITGVQIFNDRTTNEKLLEKYDPKFLFEC